MQEASQHTRMMPVRMQRFIRTSKTIDDGNLLNQTNDCTKYLPLFVKHFWERSPVHRASFSEISAPASCRHHVRRHVIPRQWHTAERTCLGLWCVAPRLASGFCRTLSPTLACSSLGLCHADVAQESTCYLCMRYLQARVSLPELFVVCTNHQI